MRILKFSEGRWAARREWEAKIRNILTINQIKRKIFLKKISIARLTFESWCKSEANCLLKKDIVTRLVLRRVTCPVVKTLIDVTQQALEIYGSSPLVLHQIFKDR